MGASRISKERMHHAATDSEKHERDYRSDVLHDWQYTHESSERTVASRARCATRIGSKGRFKRRFFRTSKSIFPKALQHRPPDYKEPRRRGGRASGDIFACSSRTGRVRG